MTDKGLEYTIFDTAAGWIGVLRSAEGLQRTTVPQPYWEEARRRLGGEWLKYAVWAPPSFADLTKRLWAYFSGQKTAFPDKLDLGDATPFQHEVGEKTRLIPYGETRSYSWVAEQIGRPGGARAVGQALARNPLPIIVPCHRVVARDGKLGGYSGGLGMKRYLLSLEASAKVGKGYPLPSSAQGGLGLNSLAR